VLRSTGVHHVDLVVRSVERTLPFYRDLLGPLGWHGISEVEGERGETIWYLLGHETQIGLREAQSPSAHDRYSVGLHHLALKVGSEEALNEIFARVSEWAGVVAEFAPEDLGQGPKRHAMVYEPGGIRLEFDFDPRV